LLFNYAVLSQRGLASHPPFSRLGEGIAKVWAVVEENIVGKFPGDFIQAHVYTSQ